MTLIFGFVTSFLLIPSAGYAQQASTNSVSNSGVFTDDQTNTYLQSLVNNGSPNDFYKWIFSGEGIYKYQTDAISAAMRVPPGATILNADGVGSYMQTACDSRSDGVHERTQCNQVPFFALSSVTGNYGAAWGANLVVKDCNPKTIEDCPAAGPQHSNLTGLEIDMGTNGSPDFVQGMAISFSGHGSAPAGSEYVYLGTAGSGGSFLPHYGVVVDKGATSSHIGLLVDEQVIGNNSPSQLIVFQSYDPSGTELRSSINSDIHGNLVLTPSSGGATSISRNGGVTTSQIQTSGEKPAADGFLRLTNADRIAWRNSASTGDDSIGEIQKVRGVVGCSTQSRVGAACSTTVTWPSAFADTAYTVSGCVGNGITSGIPVIQGITAKSKDSVVVQTVALTAKSAKFANIECVAVHD